MKKATDQCQLLIAPGPAGGPEGRAERGPGGGRGGPDDGSRRVRRLLPTRRHQRAGHLRSRPYWHPDYPQRQGWCVNGAGVIQSGDDVQYAAVLLEPISDCNV